MPSYYCKHCEYFASTKSNYNKHLTTKKHHNNITDTGGETAESIKITQNTHNYSKLLKNTHFSCIGCDKQFIRKYNLERHMKSCKKKSDEMCEMKTQIEQFKEREERLMDQIELLLTKVGNNYTTINNTNTNNIQLNNYGSEDLTHITDALKTYLLRIPFGAIQRLIEKIHFNKEKPENINLMITNKRDNKISVYEDGKWVYRNKKKTIQRLIDNKYYILDDHYNDIPDEELSDFNHTNYKSFRGKIDESDKQLLEQLYEDVEIIILNKQEL